MSRLQFSDSQAAAVAPPGGEPCAPCRTGPRPAEAPGPVLPADPREDWLEIELLDDDGQPVPDQPVEIELDAGSVLSGRTDASGLVRFEGVPVSLGIATFVRIPKPVQDW